MIAGWSASPLLKSTARSHNAAPLSHSANPAVSLRPPDFRYLRILRRIHATKDRRFHRVRLRLEALDDRIAHTRTIL